MPAITAAAFIYVKLPYEFFDTLAFQLTFSITIRPQCAKIHFLSFRTHMKSKGFRMKSSFKDYVSEFCFNYQNHFIIVNCSATVSIWSASLYLHSDRVWNRDKKYAWWNSRLIRTATTNRTKSNKRGKHASPVKKLENPLMSSLLFDWFLVCIFPFASGANKLPKLCIFCEL